MGSFHFEPGDSNPFRSMAEVGCESERALDGRRPARREVGGSAGASYVDAFSTFGVGRATVGPEVIGTVLSKAVPGWSENRLYRYAAYIYISYIYCIFVPCAQSLRKSSGRGDDAVLAGLGAGRYPVRRSRDGVCAAVRRSRPVRCDERGECSWGGAHVSDCRRCYRCVDPAG